MSPRRAAEYPDAFHRRDWKRKGGELALRTLDALGRKGIDASLTIVGCEPPVGVSGRKSVTVVPEAPDLVPHYCQSNVFLLPTRAECSAIVYCEASAFGLPIFTTDTRGVGDYVENGVNGFRLGLHASGEDCADLDPVDVTGQGALLLPIPRREAEVPGGP